MLRIFEQEEDGGIKLDKDGNPVAMSLAKQEKLCEKDLSQNVGGEYNPKPGSNKQSNRHAGLRQPKKKKAAAKKGD